MKRSESAMARRVGDELVILDVGSSHYFGLNDVGALIWDRLEQESTRADLVDAVVASYDVDREQAAGDIDDLVDQLVDRGLVQR